MLQHLAPDERGLTVHAMRTVFPARLPRYQPQAPHGSGKHVATFCWLVKFLQADNSSELHEATARCFLGRFSLTGECQF